MNCCSDVTISDANRGSADLFPGRCASLEKVQPSLTSL